MILKLFFAAISIWILWIFAGLYIALDELMILILISLQAGISGNYEATNLVIDFLSLFVNQSI